MSDHGIHVFPERGRGASEWGHTIKNLLPDESQCGHVLTIMFFDGGQPACELAPAHDGDHFNSKSDLEWGVDDAGTWHINPPVYKGPFTIRGRKR